MADIQDKLDAIRAAVNGEEVRGTIADALDAMNTQAAAAQEWATGADDPTAEPGPENNAAYYAAQAAASAATLTLDATLTSTTQAAQAAAVGMANKGVAIDAFGRIDLPYVLLDTGSIRYNTGAVSSTSWAHTDWIEIPANVTEITYTRIASTSASSTAGMAFYNDAKTYISGQAIVVGADEWHVENETITVPENAKYARFTWFTSTSRDYYKPFRVSYTKYYDESLAAKVEPVSGLVNTAAALTEDVAVINDEIRGTRQDLACTFTDGGGIRYNTGNVQTVGWAYSNFVEIPAGVEEITYTRIISTGEGTSGMAFYDATQTFISGQRMVINAQANSEILTTIPVPANAKYARFTYTQSQYLPFYAPFELYYIDNYDASIYGRLDALEAGTIGPVADAASRMGLHTIPDSLGALNIVKRCRQMTDIKWTPAVDLPRLMLVQKSGQATEGENYEGVFKAGVEYTGIPYGRANDMGSYDYDYGFVGSYINLQTFVTAISNPGSIVSKESRFVLADHETTKYAAVCSALTCYALNVAYVPTASINNIAGLDRIGKLNDSGTLLDQSVFHVGDVLNLPQYHTAMITDIIKDADGNVQVIELSDASTAGLADKNYADGQIGGVCRRKGWTLEQIYAAGSWGDYDLLRYRYAATVPYTPSPYVDVGGECNMWRIIHYPCMPYPGEGFTYYAGHIPNTDIVISPDLGYGYLRVFKDGMEFTGSPFTVAADAEKVSVGFSEAGSYEAYLCNIEAGVETVASYKCHWTVA